MAASDPKEVRKFVAPGSAGRAARMAPTAFHPPPPGAPAPDGEQAERPQNAPPPSRFTRSPGDGSYGSTYGGEEGQRRHYVPRQSQAARYTTASPPEEGSTGPAHPPPHPQGRRLNYPPHDRPPREDRAFCRPAPSSPSAHPLGRTYTFSAYRRPAANLQDLENYEKHIKVIGRFDSVEGFWAFYSHIHHPDELREMNADYHVFVEGVAPVWEHDVNRHGGKFTIRLRRGTVARLWEDLLLAFIGDQFDAEEAVCGVVVSVRYKEAERKRDTLAVWVRGACDAKAREHLEAQLKAVLQLGDSADIEYKPHIAAHHDLSPPQPDTQGGA